MRVVERFYDESPEDSVSALDRILRSVYEKVVLWVGTAHHGLGEQVG